MITTPYIGITGFTDREQVEVMRGILDAEGSGRLLAVGVMLSYKTLRGLPTKWADAWAPKETLKDIFADLPGVFNVLHYADMDPQAPTTADDLVEAIQLCGPHLHAVQLDMVWPDISMLYEAKRLTRGPKLRYLIQVGRIALNPLDSPEQVAQMLAGYYHKACLDCALFDLSGGRGEPLRPAKLLRYIDAARRLMPDLPIAVAGGLGPHSLGAAEAILAAFPDASLDAESNLRPSGNSLDPLDLELAGSYLERAAELCMRKQQAA